ncbi:MAG: hypothetical protein JO040_10385 [Gemmatimonadetes bacterium]|nr:hypothetical protein [Gemmatimonadota bacterium]
MKKHLPLLALALALAPCRGLAAQASTPGPLRLDPGTRIRVSAPTLTPDKVVGSAVSIDHEWLSFTRPDSASRGSQTWVRLAFVDTIEVSRGRSRRRRALKGSSWGAFLGGSLGIIAGGLAAKELPTSSEESAALGAVSVGLVGGAIGAAIGAIRPGKERWQPYVLLHNPLPPPPLPGGYAPASAP